MIYKKNKYHSVYFPGLFYCRARYGRNIFRNFKEKFTISKSSNMEDLIKMYEECKKMATKRGENVEYYSQVLANLKRKQLTAKYFK